MRSMAILIRTKYEKPIVHAKLVFEQNMRLDIALKPTSI